VVRLVWTIRETERLVGMVLAEGQLSWAYGLLEQMQSLQEGSGIYLVDEQGRPLLHQQGAFVFSREPQLGIAGVRAALEGQATPLFYPGLNQQHELVVGGYRPAQRAPWFVLAEQPLRWTLSGLLLVGVGLVAALLLSTGAAALLGLYITRRVAQPIARLRQGAERIGAGELEHRIVLTGEDELTDLAAEFNGMAARVEGLVADLLQRNTRLQKAVERYVAHMDEVRRGRLGARLSLDPSSAERDPLLLLGESLNATTADLQQMIVEVSTAVDRLGEAAAVIATATTQQASGATEQLAALGQVSATIQEVCTVAAETAQRASGVAEQAQRTAEVSRAGQQAVVNTISGVGQVRERVEGIAANIAMLAQRAQTIGQIVTAVGGIAAQSNLLALNAAVEAARAGEAGRGFVVVAGEMRNLATQSRAATTRVTELLTEVQQSLDATVAATASGREGTVLGLQLSGEAGEAIRQLAESVAESVQAADQIATAAGQQLVGLEQIVTAMESIRQVTTVSVSEAEHLKQTAAELRGLAERLRDAVAAYRD
jgi:methyl-accepting chemotaxis protein